MYILFAVFGVLMMLIILSLGIGLALGIALRNRMKHRNLLNSGANSLVVLLLLCMGVAMGANEVVRDNWMSLGGTALALAVCTVIGSIAAVWFIEKTGWVCLE